MADLMYILFFCAIFCSGAWSKKHGHVKTSRGKIVGGYNTTISDYPYQVYLLLQKGLDYYQCGGSIIDNRAILTAAHCLVGIQRAYIRIGSTDSDSGGTEYQSSLLFTHPQYSSRTSDYDVGVIRLTQNMTLDGKTAKVVSLAQKGASVPAGSNVTVTGWGTTSEGGDTSSNLMGVTVPVISNEDCNKQLSGITARMFCAGEKAGGKDSCQGDSGGPAVDSSGIQQGVVSFGVGCARPNLPGVYTRVAAVRAWIKTIAGVYAAEVEARIGSVESARGGKIYQAARVMTHPKYDSYSKGYDIGVMRTQRIMDLDGVKRKPIALAERDMLIPSGSKVTVSGWGFIAPEGPTSPTLKAVELETFSNEECNEKLGVIIHNSQLCAGVEDGSEDFCKGDSGGPAILSDSKVQVGIVSAGYGCAMAGRPGVLANVTDMRDWIYNHTGV